MRVAGPHSLAVGDRHIPAAGHIRVAAADGDLDILGVVGQADRENGYGSDRSFGHTGPEEGHRSLAADTNHAVVGMRPSRESIVARSWYAPKLYRCTHLSLRRVWAMRLTMRIIRLLPITLPLLRIVLVVSIALLSWLRAIIAVVLLAMAAAVVIVTRHVED